VVIERWRKDVLPLKWGIYLGLTIIILASTLLWISISEEIITTSTGIQAIYQGRTGQNSVALTFNVDWGEEYLPSILQTLKENQVPATFMVTGRWAKLNPELVLRMAEEGHEIGNHGYFHTHPNQLGRSELEEEICRTEEVVEKICAKKPRVFAPPYGEFNQRVLETAESLEYPVIMWTLDTIDWRRPPTSTIVNRVNQGVKPDCIVLMHPTDPTAQALPQILAFLKEKGYLLMTVSEIILEGGQGNS
jgi:probable sporulation protein (polysaccharide deacetylase family)